MTQILLVEDHAIVRSGIRKLLSGKPDITLKEAATGEAALSALRSDACDLVILDLNLPGLGGLELLRRILAAHPGLKVLVFSLHTEAVYAARAMEAGARGYISKNAAPEELLEAIETVLAGGTAIERDIAQELGNRGAEEDAYLRPLTQRDMEILRLLADGKSLAEIAGALGVAYKTVANTLSRIKDKPGRVADRRFDPHRNRARPGLTMRVLIACNSFKDALAADAVCSAIDRGFRRAHPDAVTTMMPLSDGGEGVLDILRRTLSLRPVALEVSDPLGRPVKAGYGISADNSTALVEMAEASGLQRLTIEERNPLLTSTFGTGQLLADARGWGARRALLAIGGSATNDAGVGAAAALGWKFLDAAGKDVAPMGGNLQQIAHIVPPTAMAFEQVEVLCDVTNPLYGPSGASWVYGRQKGGTEQSLAYLDEGLRHIAALVEKETGRKGLADVPGAGAAGGLGFGALAFMNGTLKRGIEMVLDLVGFDAAAAHADLIITGEGHIDGQSGQGKPSRASVPARERFR